MASVTLVANFLSGLRKNEELTVGNDAVSLHVIHDNSETIVALMVETITAKKGIPILSSKYAHDGWRDIDLTDHTSHSLWLEASGSQESQRREPVNISIGTKVATTENVVPDTASPQRIQ